MGAFQNTCHIYIYKIKSANIPKATDPSRYTEALQQVQAGHLLRNSFRAVIILIKTQTCGAPRSDIRKSQTLAYSQIIIFHGFSGLRFF